VAVWAKATGLPLNVMTRASDDHSLAVPVTPAVVASEQVAGAFTAAGLIPVHVKASQSHPSRTTALIQSPGERTHHDHDL
jgi:uncharacterized protein (DUF849 family)